MDELPVLVMELICDYLSYEDLFHLRLTCKKLSEYVDRRSIGSLYVFVKQNPLCLDMFHTNKQIGYANSLRLKNQHILSSIKFRSRFEHVQSLVICFNGLFGKSLLHLDQLNWLEGLKQLEVRGTELDGELSLKNLEIAFFHYPTLYGRMTENPFRLDCPRLKALATIGQVRPSMISDANDLTYLLFDNICHTHELESNLLQLCTRLANVSTVCFEHFSEIIQFLSLLNSEQLRLIQLSRIELQNCLLFDCPYGLVELINQLTVLKSNSQTGHIEFFLGRQSTSLDQLLELSAMFKEAMFKEVKTDPFLLISSKLNLVLRKSPLCDRLFPVSTRTAIDEGSEFSEDLIWKFRKTRSLWIENAFKIDQPLFQLLIRTWRSVEVLGFKNVLDLEPERFEMIAKHFVNVKVVNIHQKLGYYNFIAKFQNLNLVYVWLSHGNFERDTLKLVYESERPTDIELSGRNQRITFKKREQFSIRILKYYIRKRVPLFFF